MSAYLEAKRKAEEKRVKESLERDKSWWRSLSASEKEAGLCPWLYKIVPSCFINVPVPFCGHVDVVYIGIGGSRSYRQSPNQQQLDWLRSVARKQRGDHWKVIVREHSVLLLCDLRAIKPEEQAYAGEDSYGFITLA